jgi:hypothetical protein
MLELRRRTQLFGGNPFMSGLATAEPVETLAGDAAKISTFGSKIDDFCRENSLTAVGILYLPHGAPPKGMAGVFVSGAWQLVAKVNRPLNGMRGNYVEAIPESWVPTDILARASAATEPITFTKS